ncbi:unnamed protein product [Mytilus coruscus]|uniref:SMB domain-containing protein n=1 Tax=Mytilus coruscus TaxID=42192 RepID=A0A6J8CPD3_MYTCO|nr:unnamed protein product [Mytilus coruscus]
MSIMICNTVIIIFLLFIFFKHAFVHASDIKVRSEERRDVDSGNNASENYRTTDFTRVEENSMNRQTTFLSDSHRFSYQTSISPNAALILSEPCYPLGTCELTQTMEKQYCNCDKQCHQFKDCCHDIKYNENLNSVYTPYYHCYKASNDEYTGLFTVAECPDTEVNTTVTLLCQSNDLLNVGPCVVNNNIIFKNKYCAFCHNITLYDAFDLKIQLRRVDPSMLQENISRSERMDYFFENSIGYQLVAPNGITIRSCMLNLDGNNDTLCQMFINPVYQLVSRELQLYRNRFCVPVSSRDFFQCVGTLYDNFGRHNIDPMTILFSFEERKQKTEDCTNLNYQINASNPCDLEIFTNFVMQPWSFYLVSSVTLTKEQILAGTACFQWTMTKMIEFVKVTRTLVLLPKGDTSKVAEVKLHATITKPSFIHEIKSMEQNLNNLMWNMLLTYDNNTIEIIKEQNLPLTMQNESFGRINGGLIIDIVKDLSRNSLNLSRYDHIGCKRMSVLADQIELFKIQVIDIVCHEYYGNQDSDKSGDLSYSIKAILTYLCFSVSVVALVFSLIMNRKFNISSSIAGSNMENHFHFTDLFKLFVHD